MESGASLQMDVWHLFIYYSSVEMTEKAFLIQIVVSGFEKSIVILIE